MGTNSPQKDEMLSKNDLLEKKCSEAINKAK